MEPRDFVLESAYDPERVEAPIVERWLSDGLFAADPEAPGEPYCIILPPPNVTGALHMGHALNATLQDILIRYHRMAGANVLWQPGIDHAGIATQTVVERTLRAEEGLERLEIGREAFLERVWQWKERYGNRIVEQLQRLGASCDWSRLRFTMDEHASEAVREAFVRFYREGLIYRGEYLVNWCPSCRTALSDLEVEMEEREGALYHVRYPLADGSRHVVVATTRPETMLGDTAVAVHPEDPRWRDRIGTEVILPLVGRHIPIVGDEHVDPEYGTGVLKVTPAHDFHDEEIGRRHGLPAISIFDEEARIREGFGPYSGLDRDEARRRIVADLEAQGLLERVEPIRHVVGHCYRCHTIVEPFASQQWFLRTKPLAERVLAALDGGAFRCVPDSWEGVLRHWLGEIRDWCISRQIWWGHRIPVWTCCNCGHEDAYKEPPERCPRCGATELEQDPDVLDTWFSSALWPLTTLGWPNDDPALRTWYPTSALVTGFDILFFWVARMLMTGLHFKGKVPFRDVVLHAIVRDEHGEKMSKTRGNVIDPLEMIERYGADALRFTLAAITALGRDIRLSPKRIEGARHFANKLWNAARFVLRSVPESPALEQTPRHPFNRWILEAIAETTTRARDALERYAFNEYANAVYHLAWDRFCDWYIEGAKVLLDDPVHAEETRVTLLTGFETILRLLHPVMPFVTEALAEALPHPERTPMSLRRFPAGGDLTPELARAFDQLAEAVRGIRNIRAEGGLPPTQPLPVLLHQSEGILTDPAWVPLWTRLARVSSWEEIAPEEAPDFSATAAGAGFQIWVPLEGILDLDAELERLRKRLAQLEKEVAKIDARLANPNFVERAPAEVVAKERRRAEKLHETLERTRGHLERLEHAQEARG